MHNRRKVPPLRSRLLSSRGPPLRNHRAARGATRSYQRPARHGFGWCCGRHVYVAGSGRDRDPDPDWRGPTPERVSRATRTVGTEDRGPWGPRIQHPVVRPHRTRRTLEAQHHGSLEVGQSRKVNIAPNLHSRSSQTQTQAGLLRLGRRSTSSTGDKCSRHTGMT